MKYIVIGAGISGLTMATLLQEKGNEVKVVERESSPGGLIKCFRINGSLFHTCGGHVFNSKRQDVLNWFWTKFAREEKFMKASRNSCVFIDDNNTSFGYKCIPYPIENHVYLFDKDIQNKFYEDLDEIDRIKGKDAKFSEYENFGDFLRWRFGKTLYNFYFKPYNEKVWHCDLTNVSVSWMEGKLPMPTTQEMRINNERKIEETSFVHSTFWYEKKDGSQYIANNLAEKLDIIYGVNVESIKYENKKWIVCEEEYDRVVFCGNIKDMIKIIEGIDLDKYKVPVETLKYHGTTVVFCEIDKNPFSWIYMPSLKYKSHRIICTGNFSQTNNDRSIPQDRITATIEFTDKISKYDILNDLEHIPLNPKYIHHVYNKYTYPIQDSYTRDMIMELKTRLSPKGFYFTGRFADWEYYNMDVAIGAAMDLCNSL